MLTFLIQRVDYDQTHHRESKNNQRFEFPKELFMGRYLDKNIDQTLVTDNLEISQLRDKIQNAKSRIRHLENYNDTGYPISTILRGTLHYLDEKSYTSRGSFSKEEEILYSTIKNSIAAVSKELSQLEKNIAIYQTKIKDIYVRCKENPYNLHAVLVHDGLAGSFQFIFFFSIFEKSIFHLYNGFFHYKNF